MQALYSVSETAHQLGLKPANVRRLVQRGDLHALRIGRHWAISHSELGRFARRRRPVGRPYSQRIGWALLFAGACRQAIWLAPDERSRLKQRLRSVPWSDLLPRLHRRARNQPFYAHPGVLESIEADPRTIATGASAAPHHGIDLIAVGEVDCYLQRDHLDHLVGDFGLAPASPSDANVCIRLIEDFWPFAVGDRVAPHSAVSLDLAEAGDPRSERAATPGLQNMKRNLHLFATGQDCSRVSGP